MAALFTSEMKKLLRKNWRIDFLLSGISLNFVEFYRIYEMESAQHNNFDTVYGSIVACS